MLNLFYVTIQAKRKDKRLRDWLQQRDELDKDSDIGQKNAI